MAKDLIIKIPQVDHTDIKISGEWFDEADKLIHNAQFPIEDAESYEKAAEFLNKITKAINILDKTRKELNRPFAMTTKEINNVAKEAGEPLVAHKALLKTRINKYIQEVQAKEREEREELERQAREKAEQEMATRAALEDVFGEIDQPETIVIPDTVVEPAVKKSSSVAVVETIKFEVLDPDQVPEVFKTVDEKKIRAWIKNNSDLIKDNKHSPIAGIRIWVEQNVRSR